GEARRRSVKRKLETAELNMARLLGEHDFQKIEVLGLPLESLNAGGNKYRRAIAGRHVALRPADVFLDQLFEILQIHVPLGQRMAIKPQHLTDRPELNGG